jgi:FkbM family methyltransferase
VLDENTLEHVQVHNCALGDERAELDLVVPPVHTGYGTLGSVAESGEWTDSRRITVSVVPGDDVLAGSLDHLTAVKIDVEGFESRVVRGLRGTLSRWKPLVIAEVDDGLLRQAGSSGDELFGLLGGHGYSAFALDARRPNRLSPVRLTLRAIRRSSDLGARENNVVWLHPDGAATPRVRGRIG